MKAVYAENIKEIGIRDIPVPGAGDNDVLIKVAYAGICGSDLHAYRGVHSFRKPPVMLGHEVSGVVWEVGKNVKTVAVGDPVTVMPQIGCAKCDFCADAKINLCKNKTFPGTAEWIGTFGEYFVAPESVICRLKDVSLKLGALAEPLAVAVHVLNRIEKKQSDELVILGAGTIGLMVSAIARSFGFRKILITDIYDFNLRVAKQMNADYTVNVLRENLDEKVEAAFGKDGVGTVVIAGGNETILEQAIGLACPGGTIVYFAMITNPMTLNTYPVVFKELSVMGSINYTMDDFNEAIGLLKSHKTTFEQIITHRYGMSDAAAAFEILDKKTQDAVKIILENDF